MDRELLTTILTCDDKASPDSFNKVFMYVKNYCHHSAHAAGVAMNVCRDVTVLDVVTGQYVSATDLKQPYAMSPDTHLIQAYPKIVNRGMTTVPQIYVRTGGGWKYIGGRDEFDQLVTDIRSSSNVATIQSMFHQVKF